MKTTILDGYTLNPGDLSWHDLERLTACTIYDRTTPEQIVERCKNANIIMTNKVPITAEAMDQLPSLEYISVMATGFNVVDVVAAKERNIIVSNAAGYSTHSVVQLTMAFILELFSKTAAHSASVKDDMKWASQPDFSYTLGPINELGGKTLGIVGYGTIGKEVAKIALAFGMKVLANKRNMAGDLPKGVDWASLEEIRDKSDVISLHAPQNKNTEGMVNVDFLKGMKPNAILINTARGGLVVEDDLANALNDGIIAGVGLDVLSQEPPLKSNPLLEAKNCLITPHMAWASVQARKRLMDILIENTRCFLMGEAQNVVNP